MASKTNAPEPHWHKELREYVANALRRVLGWIENDPTGATCYSTDEQEFRCLTYGRDTVVAFSEISMMSGSVAYITTFITTEPMFINPNTEELQP
jgi:hypothetical protein